jgi:hypothetical protein
MKNILLFLAIVFSLFSCQTGTRTPKTVLLDYLGTNYGRSNMNSGKKLFYTEQKQVKELSSKTLSKVLPHIHFFHVRFTTDNLEAVNADAIFSINDSTEEIRGLFSPAYTLEPQQAFFDLFKNAEFGSATDRGEFNKEIKSFYSLFDYSPRIDISTEDTIKVLMLDTVPYALITYRFESTRLRAINYIPAGSPNFPDKSFLKPSN